MLLTDETDIVVEKIRLFVINAVRQARYEHSVRVSETAESLCARYGLDRQRGRLAGLAHDMCKDFGHELLLSLAARDGDEITDMEKTTPSLLHGRAAAVKLRRDFGVEDDGVLEAVAVHTFGRPGMCDLAKVIFVADKIEPGRPYVTPEYTARTESLSLDGLVCFVVEQNLEHLRQKGRSVAPATIRLWETLRRQEP